MDEIMFQVIKSKNDVLMLVQMVNHYQSQYELTRNQYNLTKTLFYIQSTIAIIIAGVLLFTAMGEETVIPREDRL